MINKIKITVKAVSKLMLVSLIALVACTEKEIGLTDETNGEPVKVGLSLKVEAISDGTNEKSRTVASRSVNENEVDESSIKNLWVLQFNGTEDDSKLIGTPIYIKDYSADKEINLLTSTVNNRVICIANTFDSYLGFYTNMTISEVKAKFKEVSATNNSIVTDPDNSDKHYLLMNSYEDLKISSTTTLSSSLKRNVAKISFIIKNKQESGLTFQNIQLMNVPNKNYIYTEYLNKNGNIDEFPSLSGLEVMNYNVQSVTNEENEAAKSDNGVEFTYYMPINQRGIDNTNNLTEQTKPQFALLNSTYISVFAKHTDGSYYRYKFYLGSNLINNFNIEPNKHYTYTVTFNNKGVASTDPRIDDMGNVDLTQRESSNCYIINPSNYNSRTYYIPIKRRIVEYWTNYTDEGNPFPSNLNNLEVVPQWWDCDENPITNKDVTKKITLSIDDTKSEPALKVIVPAGFTNWGNVLVAIYLKGDDSKLKYILWSWHLWITDYNPDSQKHTPNVNHNVYTVENGSIHRYDGTEWTTGAYKTKFIMDRNIGARSPEYTSDYGAGSLYYQYGRKDPFPGKYCKTPENENSTHIDIIAKEPNTGITVEQSVMYPTIFYYAIGGSGFYNWLSEKENANQEYLKANYIWNDIKKTEDDKKSIFDPSPIGWKVPNKNTWSDFADNSSGSGFNKYPNFPYPEENNPFNYRTYKTFAVYPASGFRYFTSVGLSNPGSNGFCWSNVCSSARNAYGLFFSVGAVMLQYSDSRASGFPVRSVQE